MSIQYGPGPGNASTSTNVTLASGCGGCQGLGAHTRWCPTQVGTRASLLGLYAERAEALADAIGSLDMAAANDCYAVARRLGIRATTEASLWKQRQP